MFGLGGDTPSSWQLPGSSGQLGGGPAPLPDVTPLAGTGKMVWEEQGQAAPAS